MPQSRKTTTGLLTAAAAAGACTMGAQLFVLPSGPGVAPRTSPGATSVVSAQQPLVSAATQSVGAVPLVGLAAIGAVLAARAASGRAGTSALRAAKDAAPPPFNPAEQIGSGAPLGYFDPAGFSKVGDKEGFRNLRSAELKHGRVAMMAALGAVVQHFVKLPGFEDVPSGIGAVTTAPGTYGFAALFLVSGALELVVWTQDPNKEVGDFGDPVGFGQYGADWRNREINNGRFAMFAALGVIAAELATGKDAAQQLGL